MPDWMKSIKQESMQVFLVSVGTIWFLWSKDMPMELLRYIAGLAALFIVFEKLRSMVVDRDKKANGK